MIQWSSIKGIIVSACWQPTVILQSCFFFFRRSVRLSEMNLQYIAITRTHTQINSPPQKRERKMWGNFLSYYAALRFAEYHLMLGLWNLYVERGGKDSTRHRYWERKRQRAAGKRALLPHLYSPPSNSLQFIYISATSIATAGGLSGASLI